MRIILFLYIIAAYGCFSYAGYTVHSVGSLLFMVGAILAGLPFVLGLIVGPIALISCGVYYKIKGL
jgi:hypothetical protein